MRIAAPISPSSPHRIEIRRLNFSYGQTTVFTNFDFDSNARVSIFRGASGCGKTTLLKIFYGLVPYASVESWNVPPKPYIVLQADTLVPWFSGVENIVKFSESLWEKFRSGPFFEMVKPFVEKRACDMSYGQRRSIELARAFSVESPLLLLDEPFNFLDAAKRRFFLDYINGRISGLPKSRIVLTSHYIEDVAIADADTFEFSGEMPYRTLIKREVPGL